MGDSRSICSRTHTSRRSEGSGFSSRVRDRARDHRDQLVAARSGGVRRPPTGLVDGAGQRLCRLATASVSMAMWSSTHGRMDSSHHAPNGWASEPGSASSSPRRRPGRPVRPVRAGVGRRCEGRRPPSPNWSVSPGRDRSTRRAPARHGRPRRTRRRAEAASVRRRRSGRRRAREVSGLVQEQTGFGPGQQLVGAIDVGQPAQALQLRIGRAVDPARAARGGAAKGPLQPRSPRAAPDAPGAGPGTSATTGSAPASIHASYAAGHRAGVAVRRGDLVPPLGQCRTGQHPGRTGTEDEDPHDRPRCAPRREVSMRFFRP